MVQPNPELGGAQPQSSSSEKEQRSDEPNLLWLLDLTGADIGLPPIPQDPDDRCTIWENLVSLVDFQCSGFPLNSEEICQHIDLPPPRPPAPSSSSSTASSAAAGAVPQPRAVSWSPPPPGDIDYKANPHVKPPYSYATLICMAMEASHKPKLTLADICKWIRDNFSYFRRAHPSWQSSIRHNLCINKRFVKVPREKGEPGRGAYWKLHPQYAEWLKNSNSEGRGALPEQIPPFSGRRAQPGAARRAPSPARSSLEVGAELQRLLQEFEEFESSHECKAAVENEEGQQFLTAEGQQFLTAEGQQFLTAEGQQFPTAEGQQFPTAEGQQFPTAEGQQFLTAEGQQFLQPYPTAEGQQLPQPYPTAEGQQFPQLYPTAEGQQVPQPCPTAPAEVSSLPGCAPEEPGELTELKGSADWESLFTPSLEPDFSTLDHLELPDFSPPDFFPLDTAGEQGQPQGEQQILPELSLAKPGSDETLTAAAFLEAAWNEEIAENLPSCFPLEQGDENLQASLASTDVLGWDPLDPFKSLLDMGDEMNFDWI